MKIVAGTANGVSRLCGSWPAYRQLIFISYQPVAISNGQLAASEICNGIINIMYQ